MNTSIGSALFTKTQQQIFAILYANPHQSYYLNQLVRMAGVGKGSLTRELDSLLGAELITLTRQGNQNHYQANAKCPIFTELCSIVQKTFGLSDSLFNGLKIIWTNIEIAFVYGSLAKGTERSESDIDLLLVGDGLSYADVMSHLEKAELQLGRPVNPTIYNQQEFIKRLQEHQHFIKQVIQQPKIWLKGESQLEKLVSAMPHIKESNS